MKAAAFAIIGTTALAVLCFATCDERSTLTSGKETSSSSSRRSKSAGLDSDDPASGNEDAAAAKSSTRPQRPEMKTTASGLKYKPLQRGTGTVSPKETDLVEVVYRGTLPDGTVFDASEDPSQPLSFGLAQVIKGWNEGLQLMREGDKFRFEIPPHLAYGEQSPNPKIPPNSTLIFEVELLAIKAGQ